MLCKCHKAFVAIACSPHSGYNDPMNIIVMPSHQKSAPSRPLSAQKRAYLEQQYELRRIDWRAAIDAECQFHEKWNQSVWVRLIPWLKKSTDRKMVEDSMKHINSPYFELYFEMSLLKKKLHSPA